ncbi:MAG: hypothetical protein ACKV2U_33150 [Bryobacteraceae bacterium]
MIIRNEQVEELAAATRRGFENEMVVHLAEFSPPLFKAAGEDPLRTAIRLGMSRAAGYGFDERGPVRLYLEMMLLFGSYFDTDPQYTWAAEILTNREVGYQMQRAEMLYERTLHYRKNVVGPEDDYTLQALRKIRRWAQQPVPEVGENLLPAILREISFVYPQKADYVGAEALEELVIEGRGAALRHGISTVRGTGVMIVLMLAFGHGCFEDPLYPWISRTLGDLAVVDPEDRVNRLETKALIWLDHVLAHFDGGAKT